MSDEKRYMVYCHTNKVNGKKYIGLTSQRLLSQRSKGGKAYKGCRYFWNAIQKYGWDSFSHDVLESGLTRAQAKEREQYYIALYDTQNPDNGYNIDNGGFTPVEMSPEGYASMRESIARGKHPKARRVIVFDLTGRKIGEFPCMRDAEDFYGVKINYRHVKSQRGTCHGMIFRFKDDVCGIDFLPPEQVFKRCEQKFVRGENSWHSTPIVFFDVITGQRVAEFDCLVHAKSFVKGDISAALCGRNKTVGGYVCKYAKDVVGVDVLPATELPHYETTGKCVEQYLPDGTLLAVFQSAVEAEKETGISRKTISNCVRHKCYLGGGYVWRLEQDTSPFTPPKTNWDTRWEKGCSTAIPVDQIDLKTGACIATFRSIGEAAKSAGTYKSSIKQVIDHVGNHKSAGGYGWQYHNNP